MNLLQHLRRKRAKKKKKQPFARGVFNTTSGLVRKYRLGEDFLQLVDNPEDFLAKEHLTAPQIKSKNSFEVPLFSISTKEEYLVTMSIIEKVNNPYLQFAHSPEEILLSAPLHALNPKLSNEELRRHHFEMLLLGELARKYVKELTLEAEEISQTVNPNNKSSKNERSRLDVMQERIKKLETFLAEIKNLATE